MKHLKALGLAAFAAAAMMAFLGASTASATELYSGNTTLEEGTKINASLQGSSTLESTDGTLVGTCTGGSIEGATSNAGGAGQTVSTEVTALTWSGCSFTTHTLATGSLAIDWTSGSNGTISGSGIVWTMPTAVTCRYGTGASTALGTVTGTADTGKHATIDIDAVINEQEPKSAFCPDTTRWKATYTVTGPTGLNVGPGDGTGGELLSTGAALDKGTEIAASLAPGTSALMSSTDGSSIIETCTGSSIGGTTDVAEGEPLTITLNSVAWSGCSFTKDTIANGKLSISHIAGTEDGTLSGSGTVWTLNVGISCRYGFGEGTHLGILETGKLAINTVINEQEPKAFLCADTTKWIANYVFTSPHDLTVG